MHPWNLGDQHTTCTIIRMMNRCVLDWKKLSDLGLSSRLMPARKRDDPVQYWGISKMNKEIFFVQFFFLIIVIIITIILTISVCWTLPFPENSSANLSHFSQSLMQPMHYRYVNLGYLLCPKYGIQKRSHTASLFWHAIAVKHLDFKGPVFSLTK